MSDNGISRCLNSVVDIINNAFPDGLNENQYFGLLHLLYDHMSDRNLSTVMSYVTRKDIFIIRNDIYKVDLMDMDSTQIMELKAKLDAVGFKDWVKEE